MRFPKKTRTVVGVVGGVAVAALLSTALTPSAADARARARRGGPFKLMDVNVGGFDGVYQNSVIEFTFTTGVNAATVSHAVFQIREKSGNSGFTRQVPGTFQVAGSIVRFYPRLPTHLRDPASPTGESFRP